MSDGSTHFSIVAAAFVLLGAHAAGHAAPTPDFELASLNGGFVRLRDLPQRPLILNFWRTDCPGCVREMPVLDALARSRSDIGVIGVALQSPSEALIWLRERRVEYPQLSTVHNAREILARFGNKAGTLPYTVVLDARRTTCDARTGVVDRQWLLTALAKCGSGGMAVERPGARDTEPVAAQTR